MNAKQMALDALKDIRSGWIYIRQSHGDLYGVGWDRAQEKATAAIAVLEADIAQAVEPGVKQLMVQLHDEQKWTVSEQHQFAQFLKRFPNESSQGIMSLGDAWMHGKACAEPAVNAWIAVSERLPIMGKEVWFYTDDLRNPTDQWIGIYNGEWFSCGTSVSNVTHWMPLPASPKATS